MSEATNKSAPAKPNGPVAQSTAGGNAPAAVPTAANTAPLFGGKPGKGRQRLDGLTPGTPEAIKADKEKDAARKRDERAAKKVASLPPPLPSAPASPANPPQTLVNSSGGVPVPAVPAAPVVSGGMVAWSAKLLEKPIRLLTRIVDKLRCSQIMAKVRKLGLSRDQEKEIAEGMKWKEETVNNFTTSLAEATTIELNKRQIGGAEWSHWLTVAMAGGEMALAHVDTLNRLEAMILENERIKSAPKN